MDWTYCPDSDTHVIEASSHPRGVLKCPKCGLGVYDRHQSGTDMSGDDVAGWRYKHTCGAKLLIIND